MKKFVLFFSTFFVSYLSFSQDFSNKGKEFWLAYCYHVGMVNTGGSPVMTLYITSDVSTTYTVEIFGAAVIQSGSISPNQVIPVNIPNAYFINNEGTFTNKAIHVTSAKPIVVYSYITRSQASAASLCLPTNVLGRQYYAMSFTQGSNEANSNSFFTIVAVEDNTTVEIIPSANTKNGWLANSTHTVNLNKGEIYQVLGTTSGNNGVDISGSSIKSIASATGGCKKIAVFSGSGKIAIGCAGGSSDNLYQQLYPMASWGKKYLTVPSYNRLSNYYRIVKSDPAANVYVNGVLISAAAFTNNYYQFLNTTPNLIESDLPISVTQYFTTQNCLGNGNPYDPDMIVLNPVEQNINKVTLISSNLTVAGVHQHNLHVIMRNGGTGISSFTFDNGAIPSSAWVTHPSDPNYSYLYIPNVGETSHTLYSDSGFNALAYGYGNAETYGYSAGTNVKDLYQQIGVATQYGIETTPSVCTGSPFQFKVSLPYQPLGMDWDFHGFQTPNVIVNNPTPDSTTTVNGKPIWWYSLPSYYYYNTVGIFPVTITTHTNNSDGCGTEQDIDFDLEVSNPPVADFTFVSNGCVTQPVQFTDATNSTKPTYRWWWDFGDPASGTNNTSTLKNPAHLFSAAGTYMVRFTDITTPGCLSDTVIKQITITDAPIAKFGITAPNCLGKAITFSDTSSASPPGNIIKWFWDFGDGFNLLRINNSDTVHTYNSAGNKTVTLKVETNSGCQSNLFNKIITISANPVANFSLPSGICLPADSAHFFDASTIADGTQNSFGYLWNFDDPPSTLNNTSVLKNPAHYYNNAGPFNIKMIVTSAAGCVDSITKTLSTVYPQPLAAFNVAPENCINGVTTFTDQSNGNGNTIAQWHWDFGDGQTSAVQSPGHTYAAAGVYNSKHWVVSDKGCVSDTITKTITINALPTANFAFTVPSCDTKVITFTDASVPNSGIVNAWTWDFGDPASGGQNTSILASPTHLFSSTGSYQVTLSVKTDKGCQSVVSQKTVVINAQPLAGFTLPEVCLSDAFAQFTDTSKITAGSIVNWSWNFGDPASGALNTSGSKNPQHRYNSVGNYTVTLTVTSSNGCAATLSQSFTVNGDIPVSDFTALNPSGSCANDSVSIQNTSSVNFGSVTKVEIYWDNTGTPAIFQTDDFPATGKIYKHLYPNFQSPLVKTFTIRYRAYSGASCVNDRVKTILVNATPKVQFTVIPNACSNAAPYQITQAKEIGGVPGTYQFTGPGITSTGIFTPATAGIGTHTLHYTFTSTAGCIDTISQQVTVLAPPAANFGFSTPACETKAIIFSDSSTTPAGSVIKWTWDYNDGSPVDVRTSGASFNHIFATTGIYNVKLTVTSSDQCSSTTMTKVVKINPEPVLNFSRPAACLPNANATFFDQSSISDGSENLFTYLWDFGDPSSGSSNTSIQKNPSHVYSAMGPYNVRLSVTTNNGCIKDTVIAYNNIHPQPQAKYTTNPAQVCVNSSITFSDLSSGADTTLKTWLWNFGDGSTSSLQNPPPHIFTTAGTYNVRLTVTNNNNCVSAAFSLPVIIDPFPIVDAGPPRNVLEGGNIVLEPTVTGNNLKYLWSPPDFLSSALIKNPTVTGVEDRLYTLTVTGGGGCFAFDTVFVKVLKFPKIPNTFTPNGDNINDTWIIQYLETYPGNRVQVFNRYGQLVFESRGYGKPWDGSLKGNSKGLPFGTYYYIIEPGNGRKPLTGYVTLLK